MGQYNQCSSPNGLSKWSSDGSYNLFIQCIHSICIQAIHIQEDINGLLQKKPAIPLITCKCKQRNNLLWYTDCITTLVTSYGRSMNFSTDANLMNYILNGLSS
jgi:hypothetical protein